MTIKRGLGDPDPDIVRQEFPGSQVMPGSEGGWVAVWKGHTYTGRSPEGLVSKMRSGQESPASRGEATGARA